MISLILLLPFISFVICGILGGARFCSEKGIQIFICVIWFTFWLSVFCLFMFSGNFGVYYNINFLEWFKIFPLNIFWCLEVNKVNLTMLLLIATISSLVNVFSLNYMQGDPHLSRFLAYLGLFTFFMIILVMSPNLIQLFIGWEGVGVCSYLLINFWSTRLLAAQSAYKAMIVNKVGDMAILIAIGIITKKIGSININIINSINVNYINDKLIFLSSLLLLIGVIGKSAQIGLHMWLPDAMEGPTPVSALIHAATMVTAGVFLIIRLSPFFTIFSVTSYIIIIVGSLTCVIAAIIGSSQSDLKKIIAYSTCSQLGYMVLVCGYGYYSVGLFHLFNHGIFKALLFLSAGLVIHTLFNEQNLLKMGLINISSAGKYGFVLGNLAIIGFPFLAGYYSKDLFLELIAANHIYLYPLWIGYIAASLTCLYSLKLLWLSYNKEKRYYFINKLKFHDNSFFILVPVISLGIGTTILGFIFFKELNQPVKPIIVSNLIKQVPTLLALFIVLIFILNLSSKVVKIHNPSYIIKMFVNAFYFNEIISKVNNYSSLYSLNGSYKLIDSQIIEWLASSNKVKTTKNVSSKETVFNHPNINSLIKSLVISLIISIIYLF